MTAKKMVLGKFVIVRAFTEGVHFGTLVAIEGRTVVLEEARRLHRWKGANTLHEVALHGVDEKHSRISHPVEIILLTQAGEIIPCTEKAKANLMRSRWGD